MIKLRDYQRNAIDKVIQSFQKGLKSVLLTAPTGAGKTIIFSYIAQKTAAKKKKVLILTDRFELLTQTGGSISNFGISPFLHLVFTYLKVPIEFFVPHLHDHNESEVICLSMV